MHLFTCDDLSGGGEGVCASWRGAGVTSWCGAGVTSGGAVRRLVGAAAVAGRCTTWGVASQGRAVLHNIYHKKFAILVKYFILIHINQSTAETDNVFIAVIEIHSRMKQDKEPEGNHTKYNLKKIKRAWNKEVAMA